MSALVSGMPDSVAAPLKMGFSPPWRVEAGVYSEAVFGTEKRGMSDANLKEKKWRMR
jgi:hypothetical protein